MHTSLAPQGITAPLVNRHRPRAAAPRNPSPSRLAQPTVVHPGGPPRQSVAELFQRVAAAERGPGLDDDPLFERYQTLP